MNIGFIGLGQMGGGMAANLLEWCKVNGHTLMVLDLNAEAVERMVEGGALHGQNVANVAQQCTVLFTSLPTAREVNAVALGDEGIFANADALEVWFETSTNALADWDELKAVAPDDLLLIDAPVTGGAEGAAAGTLTMLIGAEPLVLERFESLLSAFTKKRVVMGPSGAGYVAKLCQLHLNYLVAQGIGEALMLGKRAELDMDTLWDVLNSSCARSYVVESYVPKVLDGSYDPSFTLALATKDMRLISELGEHLTVPLTLGDTVFDSYRDALSQYGDKAPHLSIVRLIEEHTGQLLRSNAGGPERTV
ncbi:2-hydroxy-3-oxopropionate reductase [Grimontia celer]|uniref:2-hydroxy-3-oxopropionate reductase n=1 Tax=Grimontia celer TaxID=1796497 RepID=A0A128F858_9GAMM|nr:NAD(P)-dependent oxidoreductase [Grimontia celer]CZF82952.1 2-hydroxy-3-oxopropionate reductase [Grimontia celer]